MEKEMKNSHIINEAFKDIKTATGVTDVQEMVKKSADKISKLVCYSTGPRGEMPGRFETVDQSRENLKKKGYKGKFII